MHAVIPCLTVETVFRIPLITQEVCLKLRGLTVRFCRFFGRIDGDYPIRKVRVVGDISTNKIDFHNE